MKKNILYFLILTFISSAWKVSAQCDFPEPFTNNTGANMTVMLTPVFVSSISLDNPDIAYIVALTDNGEVVGSVYFNSTDGSSDLSQGQGTIAVWGDDTGTTELDGAISGENISLQLVDGTSLYDLSITAFTYVGKVKAQLLFGVMILVLLN